ATRAWRSSCATTELRLRALLFPGVQQTVHVPALLRCEGDLCQQPAHLGRVVVLDGGLEPLAHRQRLCKLAAEPAAQADLRGPRHSGRLTTTASPSIATEPPSSSTSRTATAAPRSRRSWPNSTGPEAAVTGLMVRLAPSA